MELMFFFNIVLIIVIIVGLIVKIYKDSKNKNKINITQEENPIFNEKYKELNEKYFSELKILAKRKKRYKIITIVIILVSLILFEITRIYYLLNVTNMVTLILGIIGVAVAVVLMNKLSKITREYKKLYKTKIISAILREVDSNLHYVDYENSTDIPYLTKYDYKMAEFDNKIFNVYRSDDHIVGRLEDNSIMRMTNLLVQYRTQSTDGDSVETLFHGIFVDIKINKNIGANIKILKNKLLSFANKEKLELDSEEFEKIFDVYADNNNVAMRILTADVMQYMLDFSKIAKYEITILKNHIYLRFETGEMFEPKMGKSAIDKKTLQGYYYILKFIIGLSKKINGEIQSLEI